MRMHWVLLGEVSQGLHLDTKDNMLIQLDVLKVQGPIFTWNNSRLRSATYQLQSQLVCRRARVQCGSCHRSSVLPLIAVARGGGRVHGAVLELLFDCVLASTFKRAAVKYEVLLS